MKERTPFFFVVHLISYILLHVIVTRKKKGVPQASDYRMNPFRPITEKDIGMY